MTLGVRAFVLLICFIAVSGSRDCRAGLVIGGSVVVTYNSTGPSQFLFGSGITQSAFQIYDRSNELNPFPPLISSVGSAAGDALSHQVVLGGPLRVTNLNYNSAGATLNDIWSLGQTLSVNGRTRFEINDPQFGQFVTFGDYNIVRAAEGLVFRDTGLGGIDSIWNTSNVTIDAIDPSHLVISGNLLLHPDRAAFVGAVAGTNVGTFTIDAITAVPEPSYFVLIGLPAACIAFRRRIKLRRA